MKQLLSALCCIFIFLSAVTAQDFPTFGYVTAEEIALKECAFDKEAAAVVLLDEAVVNHDNGSMITYRHVRIKILKESGIELANIEIPYYRKDNLETVDRIEAKVINTDNNGQVEITDVEKKSVYKKEKNQYWNNMVFAFPRVKVGSIIEYQYRKLSDNYNFLSDWQFHNYLPVVKIAFTLYIPPRLEFTYQVQKVDDYPVIIKNKPEDASVYFEMNNLPGLDNESYMDARKDYLQKISFQLSGINDRMGFQKQNTTWKMVINDFLSLSVFGTQLRKNLSGVSEFIDEVKKLGSDEAKLKAVYDYVRTNMNWNGFNSRYAGDGVKDAWNKKTGSNGEINLILINLLREAGLDADPLLVSERWHGAVKTNYPFIDQFNTVYAYVELNGKKYYLDATDKINPAAIIPKDILNTTALWVNRKNGGLVTITNNNLIFSEYIHTLAVIDVAGNATGETTVKSEGYARVEKLAALKKYGEEKFVTTYMKNDDFKTDSFKITNKETDSLPAEQEFKFSGKLKTSGDYLFFPMNNFTGFYQNPFVGDKRFSDINFGYARKITTYTSVKLPPNYVTETLPPPVRMTTPDKDIFYSRTLNYDKENHIVECLYTIEFKKSRYEYFEYNVLQQVYKKMFDYLKEPLVLKKK